MTEKPWGKPVDVASFNPKYPTEFRTSGIPDAGNGWWAKADIPKGVRLRRVSVADGSLIRVGSLKELESTGWGVEDSINYGIGHFKDPSAIYFLNPGTACNHADPTREASIKYIHDERDVYELWTLKNIKAGEEMFIHYSLDFGPCKWFDEVHNAAGRHPLSQLGDMIDAMVNKDAAPIKAEKPWGKPVDVASFNEKYPTEFRTSGIPDAGNGWWAKANIPQGVCLRRVSVAEGSLIRVGSLKALESTGWGVADSINYGIGHFKDPSAIYFLNPGTACNHADPTREASIKYVHDEKDVYELWTLKDIKAGEEMFIHYSLDFGPCRWFDQMHNAAGRHPLSQLGDMIDAMVNKAPITAEKPWGKPVDVASFNEKYPTEFSTSGIPDAGNGWWAKADIPKNVCLRRVSVADGSLIRVGSLEALESSGWGVEDSVNYGIGHFKDPTAIYFLNPGTACNHADPTREASIKYIHDEKYVYELWTLKDIKAGEEMFIHYSRDFGPCKWFDEMHNASGRQPLSQLGDIIDAMVKKDINCDKVSGYPGPKTPESWAAQHNLHIQHAIS